MPSMMKAARCMKQAEEESELEIGIFYDYETILSSNLPEEQNFDCTGGRFFLLKGDFHNVVSAAICIFGELNGER